MTRLIEILISLAIVAVLFLVVGIVLPSSRHLSHSVETNRTLVIVNGRIERIVASAAECQGERIDLSDSFVLPGLIDSHVHLTSQQNPNARLEEVTQSAAAQAMVGAGTCCARSRCARAPRTAAAPCASRSGAGPT